MNNERLQPYLTILKESHAEKQLFKAHRRAWKAQWKETTLSRHHRLWLQSQLFDMAAELGSLGENELYWLEDAVKLIWSEQPTPDEHNAVYFSPGDDGLNAIKSQIDNAVNSLDVCVFTISDNRISDALVSAHRRGVNVRIITDDHKRHDTGSDVEELKDKKLSIKIDYEPVHMHHKFAIIDGEQLITGSYNWTRSAATKNYENVLITEDALLIKGYQKEFDRLWDRFGWL